MTEIEKRIIKFILKWEGGYSEAKTDRGNKNNGCTNKGITLETFREFYGKDKTKNDVKNMTNTQWLHIFEKGFYNKIKCEQVKDGNIQLIWCDWFWGSGIWAVKRVQRLLKLTEDGIVGPKTISAINAQNPKVLFLQIKADRLDFYDDIVKNHPDQSVNLKGWRNRLNAIEYK